MIKEKCRIVISYVGRGAEDWNRGGTHQELKEIGNILLLRFRDEFIITILLLCFIICIMCILLHIQIFHNTKLRTFISLV